MANEKIPVTMGDLTNAPTLFILGEREVQVKRLSLSEIWGEAEKAIRRRRLDEAKILAEDMKIDERNDFLLSVLRKAPSREESMQAMDEWAVSSQGIARIILMAAKKGDPTVSEDDIAAAAREATAEQLAGLSMWCLGMDEPKNGAEEGKKGQDSLTGLAT